MGEKFGNLGGVYPKWVHRKIVRDLALRDPLLQGNPAIQVSWEYNNYISILLSRHIELSKIQRREEGIFLKRSNVTICDTVKVLTSYLKPKKHAVYLTDLRGHTPPCHVFSKRTQNVIKRGSTKLCIRLMS